MTDSPETSLVRSLAQESLADLLGTVADTALVSLTESGALNEVPIIGMLIGLMKAQHDIRSELFIRKVKVYLREFSKAPADLRKRFIGTLNTPQEQQEFGQAVLLLLERADSMAKPAIIGRIMCALVEEKINYFKAMRLCAIVDRCYIQDLEFLKNFKDGAQGANVSIVESLFAAGLITNAGLHVGSLLNHEEGAFEYKLNEYGKLLLQHALTPNRVM